jgi:hypothetical protein
MARETAATSLKVKLNEGVHRLTQWAGFDLIGSIVTEDDHLRGERHVSQGDVNRLCNWGQHNKSTMPKLDSVFLRGMKLSNSYRSCRKRSIS